jgi:hypothetical protein
MRIGVSGRLKNYMLRVKQRTLRHSTQGRVEGASRRLIFAGLKPCASTGRARSREAGPRAKSRKAEKPKSRKASPLKG